MGFINMAVTFEAINDEGILQIDDENKALALIDKRTLNIVNQNGLFYQRFVLTTTVAPLVTVRNTGNRQAICTGIKAVSGGYEICIVADNAGEVVVYSFGQVPVTQSNFGLQLFNAQGELTFDALSKWIKVAAITTSDYAQTYVPPTLDTSKQYAYAGCTLERGWSEASFWFDNYWTGDGSAYCSSLSIGSNNVVTPGQVNTAYWTINEFDSQYPGDADYRWDARHQGTFSTFMLIDVTGY